MSEFDHFLTIPGLLHNPSNMSSVTALMFERLPYYPVLIHQIGKIPVLVPSAYSVENREKCGLIIVREESKLWLEMMGGDLSKGFFERVPVNKLLEEMGIIDVRVKKAFEEERYLEIYELVAWLDEINPSLIDPYIENFGFWATEGIHDGADLLRRVKREYSDFFTNLNSFDINQLRLLFGLYVKQIQEKVGFDVTERVEYLLQKIKDGDPDFMRGFKAKILESIILLNSVPLQGLRIAYNIDDTIRYILIGDLLVKQGNENKDNTTPKAEQPESQEQAPNNWLQDENILYSIARYYYPEDANKQGAFFEYVRIQRQLDMIYGIVSSGISDSDIVDSVRVLVSNLLYHQPTCLVSFMYRKVTELSIKYRKGMDLDMVKSEAKKVEKLIGFLKSCNTGLGKDYLYEFNTSLHFIFDHLLGVLGDLSLEGVAPNLFKEIENQRIELFRDGLEKDRRIAASFFPRIEGSIKCLFQHIIGADSQLMLGTDGVILNSKSIDSNSDPEHPKYHLYPFEYQEQVNNQKAVFRLSEKTNSKMLYHLIKKLVEDQKINHDILKLPFVDQIERLESLLLRDNELRGVIIQEIKTIANRYDKYRSKLYLEKDELNPFLNKLFTPKNDVDIKEVYIRTRYVDESGRLQEGKNEITNGGISIDGDEENSMSILEYLQKINHGEGTIGYKAIHIHFAIEVKVEGKDETIQIPYELQVGLMEDRESNNIAEALYHSLMYYPNPDKIKSFLRWIKSHRDWGIGLMTPVTISGKQDPGSFFGFSEQKKKRSKRGGRGGRRGGRKKG